jgi:hypothetical protein
VSDLGWFAAGIATACLTFVALVALSVLVGRYLRNHQPPPVDRKDDRLDSY